MATRFETTFNHDGMIIRAVWDEELGWSFHSIQQNISFTWLQKTPALVKSAVEFLQAALASVMESEYSDS